MSPLGNATLHEEDTSGESGQDGWSTAMPVIIAANRLPVRVTRTVASRRRNSAKDAREDEELSEKVEWHVEWAGDRVIEAQNTFSHHEISDRANVKFVGRISEYAIPVDEQRELALKLQEFNCYPVFIDQQEAKLYYEDYCKQTLWPTFHNVVDVYSPVDVVLDVNEPSEKTAPVWNPGSQKVAWQAYANVNQLFAQVTGSSSIRGGVFATGSSGSFVCGFCCCNHPFCV